MGHRADRDRTASPHEERLPESCLPAVQTFAAFACAVAGERDLKEILRAFSDQLPHILPFDRSSISVIAGHRQFTWQLARGGKVKAISKTSTASKGSLVDLTMRQKRLIIVNDLEQASPTFAEQHILRDAGTRSLLSFPLKLEGRIIGVMDVESNERDAYSYDDEPIVSLIGSQIAIALDRSDIFRKQAQQIEDVGAQLVRAGQMATVGQLAAVVAHEVKNKFGAIRLRTQLLQRLATTDPAALGPHLEAIVVSIDQGVRLMQDLLHYAKPVPPSLRPFSLQTAVQDAVALGRRPDIRVEVDIPEDLPPAWGDPGQFGQVLVNLVLNALDAMPHGGTLRIAGRLIGDCLEVTIADTGVGISEANLNRIFEPFFTTKRGGTGLGMSICKSIIEAQDGSIDVESQVGKGTTLIVRLPRAEAHRQAA